jgi:two-component system, NarL family, sensor kinase
MIVFYIIASAVILFLLTALVNVQLVLHRKKQLLFLQEKETMRNNYEQAILQSQVEIREQAAHQISLELHDNVGQLLSLAKMQLSSININDPGKALQKVNGSMDLVSRAVEQVRNLAKTLDSEQVLSSGFLNAFRFELQLLEKIGIFQTELCIEGQEYELDKKKELVLFRAVQEILNNIAKHAQARHINATIQYFREKLCVTVSDDGIGFNHAEVKNKSLEEKGSGLINIHKRIEIIGARVHINSTPDTGTTIRIELPV